MLSEYEMMAARRQRSILELSKTSEPLTHAANAATISEYTLEGSGMVWKQDGREGVLVPE